MRPELDNQNDQPGPSADRSAYSRRAFLRASAVGTAAVLVGTSVGFVAGLPSAESAEIPDWTAADIPAQNGSRVLVTGGNGYPQDDRSGLGYQDALALARAGADVTIASRDQARGEEAVRRILADAPGATVRFETLDLADLTSVRAFAARMRASGQGLDVLINNAGVM